MSVRVRVLLIAGIALAVSACGGAAAEPETGGSELLTGDFATVSGGQVDLDALQGQDVVLWFWAPW